MAIEFAEISICVCCVMSAANGDESGHDHSCGDDEPRPLALQTDSHVIVASSEEYEPWFSWSSCEGCGSHLGGDRHKAYVEVTPPSVAEHRHGWTTGMMYVSDEDLDAVAAVRKVECESCDAVYQTGSGA